jgi:hypothetical protein
VSASWGIITRIQRISAIGHYIVAFWIKSIERPSIPKGLEDMRYPSSAILVIIERLDYKRILVPRFHSTYNPLTAIDSGLQ